MNVCRFDGLVAWAVWCAVAAGVAACGNPPTSSPPVVTGGVPGVGCDTQFQSQGCYGLKKTACVASGVGTSGVWQDLGDCLPGQYCIQEVDPLDVTKRVAACKSYGNDTGLGADALASDSLANDASATGDAEESDGGPEDGEPTGDSGDSEGNEDAGTSDAEADVPLPEGCGNGVCDIGENSASCPLDCKPPAKCGDAKCEGSENTSCLLDCAPWTTATLTCAAGKCTSAWNACLKDAKCKNYFNCAATCKCSSGCLALCAKGLESHAPLVAVQGCIGDQGCPDPCPAPTCGDGQCMGDEDNGGCPEDCPEHPCDAACGGQAPSGCLCTPGCGASNDCCNQAGEQAAKSCVGSTCGQCK